MTKFVIFEDDHDFPINRRRRNKNGLFYWTIFILLLTLLAAFCWVGSYYIFGCPEKPLSYWALKKLRKLENIQQFELTTAPKGEFLDSQDLFRRYGAMAPQELESANSRLLRNFIRNYRATRDLVPYIVGTYAILDSFELNTQNFFSSGAVSIAQSIDFPTVLLESVFTTRQQSASLLRRTLLTGLTIRLEKRFDLAALIHVKRTMDNRMLFTALPILYGSYYTAHFHPESVSLSPPETLNIKAGLPILSQEKIVAADAAYRCDRRRSDGAQSTPSLSNRSKKNISLHAATTTVISTEKGQLIRIARPELLLQATHLYFNHRSGYPMPILRNTQSCTALSPSPTSRKIGAISSQVNNTPRTSEHSSKAAMVVTLEQSEDRQDERSGISIISQAPLEKNAHIQAPIVPMCSYTDAAPAQEISPNLASTNWHTYKVGHIPYGRLVDIAEVPQLTGYRLRNHQVYLKGNFLVTASCLKRAVLRPRNFKPFFLGNRVKTVRIIVDFPSHSAVPALGTSFRRGPNRPFLITDIQRSSTGGIINVFAREVIHD